MKLPYSVRMVLKAARKLNAATTNIPYPCPHRSELHALKHAISNHSYYMRRRPKNKKK